MNVCWIWFHICLADVFIWLAHALSDIRIPDNLFDNSTLILDRKIHCDNDINETGKAIYPAQTWSCTNIRVGNLRMPFETGFGWSFDEQGSSASSPGAEVPGPASKNSKDEFDGENDLGHLCRLLLNAHGVNDNLWAAYALDTQYESAARRTERVIFTTTVDKNSTLPSPRYYTWELTATSPYYIGSLKCMLMGTK